VTGRSEIKIIIPWFGQLPGYTRLFFDSCALNGHVTFLFFTDQKVPFALPENVKPIPFNLKKFNRLVTNKTGAEVWVKYPYKLCDFKPLYGHIFEDYLSDVLFWGYTDIDMIFSSFSNFLTEDIFSSYDIVTARSDSFAGNFTLFKNHRTNKLLYQESPIWKTIIQQTFFVYSFPERFKENGRPASEGIGYKLHSFRHKNKLKRSSVNDLNEITNARPDIKVFYGDFILSDEFLNNRKIPDWKVKWKNGKWHELVTGREALYFHFYKLKSSLKYLHLSGTNRLNFSNLEITSTGINLY
jgi:hypothetical protein